jgi:hypothetical protein
MSNSLVYHWDKEKEVDVLYFSRVLSYSIKKEGDDAPIEPLAEDVAFCEIDACPLLERLKGMEPAKKALAEAKAVFTGVQEAAQLFPCPVYASPLLMMLNQVAEEQKMDFRGIMDLANEPRKTMILQDSFVVIKKLCAFERMVSRLVSLSATQKANLQRTRDKFMDRIAQFTRTEGGLNYCFQMPRPPAVDTGAAFIKENFFNCVNVIRVLEFTILDLLEVAEAEQQSFATYASAEIPKSVLIKSNCWKSLNESFKMGAPEKARNEVFSDPNSQLFVSSQYLAYLYTTSLQSFVKNYIFPCFNCKKMETAKARFPRCSRCSWCCYCSVKCQTEHWKVAHKANCLKPKDLRELDKERLLIGGEEATKQ